MLRRARLLHVLLLPSLNVTISAQEALTFTSNRASTHDFLDLSVRVVWLLSCVQLFVTPWTVAHQAPRPWVSPGKNTGVGCHSLL